MCFDCYMLLIYTTDCTIHIARTFMLVQSFRAVIWYDRYPFRLPHGRFAGRYRPLLKKKSGRVSVAGHQDVVAICESILNSVPQDFSKVAIGNTMVLYRADEHRVLELLRNLCLDRVIPYAQRKTRQYIGLQFRKALKQVRGFCQEAIADGNDADLFDEAIENSQTAIAPFRVLFNYEPHPLKKARDMRFRLQERVELNKEFRRLARLDCMEHFDAFTSAVVRSDKIPDMPGLPCLVCALLGGHDILYQLYRYSGWIGATICKW